MRSLVPTLSNGNRRYMASPQRSIAWDPERIVDRLLGNGFEAMAHETDGAPLEIMELDEVIKVSIEVPGIDPDALDVRLSGQVLTFTAEKHDPDADRENHRTYSERRFGTLHRSVKLPCPVEMDDVKAEHRHGVVTITLTKSEAVRPKRIRIEKTP